MCESCTMPGKVRQHQCVDILGEMKWSIESHRGDGLTAFWIMWILCSPQDLGEHLVSSQTVTSISGETAELQDSDCVRNYTVLSGF